MEESLQAGRLEISAETAQEMPKFERAPLIIPHGKYKCMLLASDVLFPGSWVEVELSVDDMRDTHANLSSCKTNVPYMYIYIN